MTTLPEVPLKRALRRVESIWSPEQAPHMLVFGQTGSGKTTLMKSLLGLCEQERALILDPKPAADAVWDGTSGDPYRWGRPVTQVDPVFGYKGEPGGGPHRMWYRLVGSPNRADTARRFGDALDIVAAEGHVVLVCDDVREICRQLKLAERVDSVLNLARSNSTLVILAATETGWVSGKAQAGMTWVGATSGLDAAKAGAALIGKSGRQWYELTGAIEPHQWIYADSQSGTAGPVLVR
jgi:energy-coupling factor transporter ATP-binding protein EcfA2